MSVSESKDVEITLQRPGVHQQWEDSFRTAENERFYETAFDYLTQILNAPQGTTILDVGCGPAAHSVRLAKRGYSVIATDFSDTILKEAKLYVQANGQLGNINLHRENLLSLSFPDNSFNYILCWGVLMHIPDVEQAISELTRVLKKGGILIISEGNMHSLQSMIFKNIRLLFDIGNMDIKMVPTGLECWKKTNSGKFLTRQANIKWLTKKLKSNGFKVDKHVSGQFTELYRKCSSPLLKKFIHGFNYFWFQYIKVPYLSYGNILILKKQNDRAS